MRRIFTACAVAASLVLASCAADPFSKSVLEGGTSLTATVNNPVTLQQQAEIEATYTVAAAGVLAYARLPRCSKSAPPCSSWPVVQKMKSGESAVFQQLQNLRTFMDNNQTVSAISAYNAASKALRDLKAVAFVNNIKVD